MEKGLENIEQMLPWEVITSSWGADDENSNVYGSRGHGSNNV